jgi:hypothetical protein
MACRLQHNKRQHIIYLLKKMSILFEKSKKNMDASLALISSLESPLAWISLYQNNSADLTFLVIVTRFFLYHSLVFYFILNFNLK